MQYGGQQLVELPALALPEVEHLEGRQDAAKVFGVVPAVAHDAAALDNSQGLSVFRVLTVFLSLRLFIYRAHILKQPQLTKVNRIEYNFIYPEGNSIYLSINMKITE